MIFKFIIGIFFKFEFFINLFIYLLFILFIIFVWIHLTINNFLIVKWLQTWKPLVFNNLEFWGSLEINIFFLLMILKVQTFFWVQCKLFIIITYIKSTWRIFLPAFRIYFFYLIFSFSILLEQILNWDSDGPSKKDDWLIFCDLADLAVFNHVRILRHEFLIHLCKIWILQIIFIFETNFIPWEFLMWIQIFWRYSLVNYRILIELTCVNCVHYEVIAVVYHLPFIFNIINFSFHILEVIQVTVGILLVRDAWVSTVSLAGLLLEGAVVGISGMDVCGTNYVEFSILNFIYFNLFLFDCNWFCEFLKWVDVRLSLYFVWYFCVLLCVILSYMVWKWCVDLWR